VPAFRLDPPVPELPLFLSVALAAPRPGVLLRQLHPQQPGQVRAQCAAARADALDEDDVIKSALPGDMWRVFRHYKRDEWERYCAEVTDWDVKEYLDVLP